MDKDVDRKETLQDDWIENLPFAPPVRIAESLVDKASVRHR